MYEDLGDDRLRFSTVTPTPATTAGGGGTNGVVTLATHSNSSTFYPTIQANYSIQPAAVAASGGGGGGAAQQPKLGAIVVQKPQQGQKVFSI